MLGRMMSVSVTNDLFRGPDEAGNLPDWDAALKHPGDACVAKIDGVIVRYNNYTLYWTALSALREV